MKVYKQWLADENNEIVYKTLTEWAEYFGLKEIEGTNGLWETKNGMVIDIIGRYGRGIAHDHFDEYADDLFFVGNADLDSYTIRIKL